MCRRSPAHWCSCLVAALLLGGCASRAPQRDGPDARPPADLEQRPDAEPRVEPVRAGGPNKPYEVFGRRYVPLTGDVALTEAGGASWYGRKFHGQPTASGEPYDMYAMSAAHKTMPIPSYARVRNPANGREVIVRINDRGPFVDGRVVDLSYTAALKLGLLRGVAPVQVQRLTFDEIRSGNWRSPQPGATPADSVMAARPPVAAAGPPAVGRAPIPLPPDDLAPGDAFPAGLLWLQLGAFRQRDAALQLLQRALFEADTAVRVVEESGLFRVQAGPFDSLEQAQREAVRLRRLLGVSPVPVDGRPARP